MIILLSGVLLSILGLFAGLSLVLAPLGLARWSATPALWVLFPLFGIAGYVLVVIGARARHMLGASFVLSALVLLLALAAAVGLVLTAASIIQPDGGTYSLWYVLVIGGVLGFSGTAARSRSRSPEAAIISNGT